MFHDFSHAAKVRRTQIEEGRDLTFSQVFLPYWRDVLVNNSPQSVLEVGCGTGHLAKSLFSLTDEFVALEPSPGMYREASEVLTGTSINLRNEALEFFETKAPFRLTFAHLCAQTIPDLARFLNSCASTLSCEGLLVFSIPHPCYWNDYREYFSPDTFRYTEELETFATLEISNDPSNKIANIPYYHRPIGRYVAGINKVGLVIEKLDEIFPTEAIQKLYPKPWSKPRYCVFHARKRSW